MLQKGSQLILNVFLTDEINFSYLPMIRRNPNNRFTSFFLRISLESLLQCYYNLYNIILYNSRTIIDIATMLIYYFPYGTNENRTGVVRDREPPPNTYTQSNRTGISSTRFVLSFWQRGFSRTVIGWLHCTWAAVEHWILLCLEVREDGGRQLHYNYLRSLN